MNNPFAFNRELRAGQLVDREDEVRMVVQTIEDHGTLFLIGPRRFGKTSILKVAEEEATAAGAIVLRVNAEAYPDLQSLVQAIVLMAASRLRRPVGKTAEYIRRFFAHLRPEISYNPIEQSWTGSLGFSAEPTAAQTPFFVDALKGVAQLADALEQPTALMIDEFQKVIELGGPTAEGQVRAAVQQHSSLAYVFAGSKTHVMNDMTLNPARPFYRLGARCFLGAVPRADFTAAIRKGFTRAHFAVHDEAITYLLDAAEDVPYTVQALAHTAWNLLRERTKKSQDPGARETLTMHVVEQARTRLVKQDNPFYTQVWNALTGTQQKVLLAVVHERGRLLQSQRVTTQYGVAHNAMRQALVALMRQEVIREEQTVGNRWWRLEDPLFGAWIRQRES